MDIGNVPLKYLKFEVMSKDVAFLLMFESHEQTISTILSTIHGIILNKDQDNQWIKPRLVLQTSVEERVFIPENGNEQEFSFHFDNIALLLSKHQPLTFTLHDTNHNCLFEQRIALVETYTGKEPNAFSIRDPDHTPVSIDLETLYSEPGIKKFMGYLLTKMNTPIEEFSSDATSDFHLVDSNRFLPSYIKIISPIGEKVRKIASELSFEQMYDANLPVLAAGSVDRGKLYLPENLGNYHLTSLIGKGGFADVYKAVDKTSYIEHTVALKVPKNQAITSAEWRTQTIQEADNWHSLSLDYHPHVVRLEDFKFVAPYSFFVMEYMEKGSIASCIKEIENISERITILISALEQTVKGLAFAHQKQIVHGDVKASNILVGKDFNEIKLADFGISYKVGAESATEQNMFLGHPIYLAPELIDRKTFQSDVYALGVTFYALFMNEFPFINPEVIDASYYNEKKYILDQKKLQFDVAEHLEKSQIILPKWLRYLLSKCLAYDPRHRFKDAQEILDYMAPFLHRSKNNQIMLSVKHNFQDDTLDYSVEIKRKLTRKLLSVSIPILPGPDQDMRKRWQKMGEYALEWIYANKNALPTETIEQNIQSTMKYISTTGSDNYFLKKLCDIFTHEIEKSQGLPTLSFMYEKLLMDIPWELFSIDKKHLCLLLPMSRVPKLKIKGNTRKEHPQKIRVLLIIDPTKSLGHAKSECDKIADVIRKSALSHLIEIDRSDHTFNLSDIQDKIRNSHIIHFAGHSHFDPQKTRHLGWLYELKPRKNSKYILHTHTLRDFWNMRPPPFLIFSNSCNSARNANSFSRTRANNKVSLNFAETCISAGVTNFIGTVWDAPDSEATQIFPITFYREFFSGQTVARSVFIARNELFKKYGMENLTWARYVLYGDPLTRLVEHIRSK